MQQRQNGTCLSGLTKNQACAEYNINSVSSLLRNQSARKSNNTNSLAPEIHYDVPTQRSCCDEHWIRLHAFIRNYYLSHQQVLKLLSLYKSSYLKKHVFMSHDRAI